MPNAPLVRLTAALALAVAAPTVAAAAPFMVIGADEKLVWNGEGKPVLSPPGHDSVIVVDLADPENPTVAGQITLKNSVVGPPVNIAITADGQTALVADSVDVVKQGDALKQVPDSRLYVLDLGNGSPTLRSTLTLGTQPSGLDIAPDGRTALVANRGDGTITVLSIDGPTVSVKDTVTVGTPADQVADVSFAPDGRRALAVKFASHKVAVIETDRGKASYAKLDLPTGVWPYNVAVAPSGSFALTADNGNAGAADGNVDTLSVVDLEANPPRIIDRVVVGDAPEGLAISPKGNLVAAALLGGGNSPRNAFWYTKTGSVAVLTVDGKHLTRTQTIPVGALPEPICFTPDGRYILVGNYLDGDLSILKVDGTTVTDTGKRFKLPGHPASARMTAR